MAWVCGRSLAQTRVGGRVSGRCGRRSLMSQAEMAIVRAVIAALDEDAVALDLLTDLLASRLDARSRQEEGDRGGLPDEWLDSKHAAAHLGISVAALHKLTAARSIP